MKYFNLNHSFLNSKQRSAWGILIKVILSVFCAETSIMLLFLVLPPLPDLVETLVDSTLLSVLIAPALYFLVYRPLLQEISQRSQIEAELRRSQATLKAQAQELAETLEQLQQAPQLIQAEKMSGLGRLVAGIVHEINNPIGFIYGNLTPVQDYTQNLLELVQLYQQHYPDPNPDILVKAEAIDLDFLQEDLTKTLNSIKFGTERVRQVMLSLRNFSRMDEASFKSVDIHEGIDSTLILLQHRLKSKSNHLTIEVVKDYGNLPRVECFPGQLNQVFISIFNNAIDAIEELSASRTSQEIEDNPGRITIRTALIGASQEASQREAAEKSPWIEIAIADNGVGIPDSIQAQIFNPFFTTKPIGQATGMGLSISYQIITKNHSGKISCFSTPGIGTEIVIQIPLHPSACDLL
jgi:two-component system, NtrC family, sensor kinase